MFDKKRFKAAMALADKSYKDLAEALGIDTSTLYRKANGQSEFTRSEIQVLCEIMCLETPMDIFFSEDIA